MSLCAIVAWGESDLDWEDCTPASSIEPFFERELSSTPGWLQLNQIFASVLALSLGCYLSYCLVAVRRPQTKETLTEERI